MFDGVRQILELDLLTRTTLLAGFQAVAGIGAGSAYLAGYDPDQFGQPDAPGCFLVTVPDLVTEYDPLWTLPKLRGPFTEIVVKVDGHREVSNSIDRAICKGPAQDGS